MSEDTVEKKIESYSYHNGIKTLSYGNKEIESLLKTTMTRGWMGLTVALL